MNYTNFSIENYRAIRSKVEISLSPRIIPLVGVNECGKTTILQAIFCFDNVNDNQNEGKHLKNIDNLYDTVQSGDSIVSASIKCSYDELKQCFDDILHDEKLNRATTLSDNDIELAESFVNHEQEINMIHIARNLSQGRKYTSSAFSEFSDEFQHQICSEIVSYLPSILYNDDFNDRPVCLAIRKYNFWQSKVQSPIRSSFHE